ncbi:LuxR C-terminal-related transcriptional regulator [Amycolatopsis sp. NPDC059657]|uniref:helix-turn-helix transcriptional regulator n=1 Tax=Amycolatopsis sp. NPDC059657 TaxID=3346899 RepID=UPI003673119D
MHCILSNGSRACAGDPLLLDALAGPGGRRQLLVDPTFAAAEQATLRAMARQFEIRICGGVLRHMLIFDTRYAVVPLDEASLDAGVLVLRAPLVAPCSQVFEIMWAESRPLGGGDRRRDGLSARQLDVATLLVEGATDCQVANRLGMSSRTVRTVVSELHSRYGTTSRMALGFRLGSACRCG